MLKVVVNQTQEEVSDYEAGQKLVPFICDSCGNKKLVKLCEIEPDRVICAQCRARQDRR